MKPEGKEWKKIYEFDTPVVRVIPGNGAAGTNIVVYLHLV